MAMTELQILAARQASDDLSEALNELRKISEAVAEAQGWRPGYSDNPLGKAEQKVRAAQDWVGAISKDRK